ncbi:LysM peptidoglycan-binding domain-containing protein [Flectobacillus roseus]|uniref:LysM peptidoglycan-binding domain-containing protein n=1 Tax=Flectobacillus roseus TaxID=502259 RepID=UPI0024B7DF1E|nr:LysM peptidoglycan-binding domain-containing protein [Flectobacillus roseus]MDI9870336.1 LysM peptidoglycan-binding domain-containing protein [Flectobacillus roseus]
MATYTVQPKDTLYSIAKKFNISVDQLKQFNNLYDNNISIGQTLNVSSGGGYTPSYSDPVYPSNNPVYPNTDPVYPNNSTPNYGSYSSGGGSSYSGSGSGGSTASSISSFVVRKDNKGSYNSIVISYPSSYGTDSTGTMRDNYPSPNLVNPRGVSYFGKSTFDSQRYQFEDLLPKPFYADVLHFIGKNEGCFDAVNSYDKAIFSFGFIQFTGASASGSILSKVLQRMKQNNSDTFYNSFGKFGVDVSGYGAPVVSVRGASGDAAFTTVANDLQLTGVFIAAGFEREMIRAQIQIAQEEYMNKALSDATGIGIFGQQVPLNRILFSEGGIALRVDLAVNRGLSGSLAVLQKAVTQAASSQGIYSASGLGSIDERSVVQAVINNDVEQWKKDRTQKLLNSSFSFDKYYG